jgi:2-dehydro-3-deoxy-D-arabinonate dehydratase
VLSTGTSLVPDMPFTLMAGDVVRIAIDGLAELTNPVVRGKVALRERGSIFNGFVTSKRRM